MEVETVTDTNKVHVVIGGQESSADVLSPTASLSISLPLYIRVMLLDDAFHTGLMTGQHVGLG